MCLHTSYHAEDEATDNGNLSHVKAFKDLGTREEPIICGKPVCGGSDTGSVLFWTNSPPVLYKLVKISEGEFIEMADLLPDKLASFGDSESTKPTKKRKIVTNILEWVRCFSLYVSIISRNSPERVSDLLGYQMVIIDAYNEYQGDHWLVISGHLPMESGIWWFGKPPKMHTLLEYVTQVSRLRTVSRWFYNIALKDTSS